MQMYVRQCIARCLLVLITIFIFQGCKKDIDAPIDEVVVPQNNARFTLMSPDNTQVTFSNLSGDFKEDYNYNIFRYEYLYNGGGVAAGDVNGDNLPDLYFTSTFSANKLYLNLGDFRFQDVTDQSGVSAAIGFKTGTTMADINGDGRLDIYVCRTGKDDDGKKTDHVFINTGNKIENGIAIPVFEDQAIKLGLADNSNTNHVCFFDMDRDGDLDLFQLNHRVDFETSTDFRLEPGADSSIIRITTPKTPFESNRLYRNDNGHFTDITVKAGMVSSAFGLSITPADLNSDGWMDLYVANDYIEPDRVYINNRNGTFTDHFSDYLKHCSLNSMGSDIADINNDGLDDIMVLDMKAEDPLRYKTLINGMEYDRYNLLVQYGYGRQVGRNVLQLNNGNNTFSEIGQYAGIAATDWSWGSLIVDLDNDGWKDVYIANGYRRDVANLDYLTYVRDSLQQTGGLNSTRFPDINDILAFLPEKKLANYLLINNKQLGFDNSTVAAGMNQPSFSNGSAFADLDRDGDLDLIVNNVEDPAFIYRNDVQASHWLQIDLKEKSGNTDGIGAQVDVFTVNTQQHQCLITNKGFLSSSEPILHFGLGDAQKIDSIILQWPDGKKEIIKSVEVDQRITWTSGYGKSYTSTPKTESKKLFTPQPSISGWMHMENEFVDFKRERLIPYMLSFEGPCLSIGDVNGDKLDDIYAGNGSGYASSIFIQQENNVFTPLTNKAFVNDALYEDCGSVMEDMDGDGDLDLMVVSGGNSFQLNAPEYMTRYYVNDGKGKFSRVTDFPIIRTNAGAILALDFDMDEDMDVIIAGRSTPGSYPSSPRSYLLENVGGKFKDITKTVFPDLETLGMITDMVSGDLDGDKRLELVFVGDWLPISVFSFDGRKFTNQTNAFGLEETTGWWRSIHLDDMDQDGDLDILGGNIGLNTRLVTSEKYPVTLITNDFDKNGSLDPVLCFYYKDQLYPYAGRDLLITQIPVLKKKFGRYALYASAPVQEIFTNEEMKGSTTLKANTFETLFLINENKKFAKHTLPYQAQISPVYDFIIEDFDQDGRKDMLIGGNYKYAETETGEWDAGNGALLLQNADGTFRYIPNAEHGFWAQQEARELRSITLADGRRAIMTGNNQGPLQMHIYTYSK